MPVFLGCGYRVTIRASKPCLDIGDKSPKVLEKILQKWRPRVAINTTDIGEHLNITSPQPGGTVTQVPTHSSANIGSIGSISHHSPTQHSQTI